MAQKGYIKNSVTADLGAPELAAIFKSIMPANGIINIFDDLECARINDNLVRLSPGVYNLSGYLLGVMQGTTADLAVDSGTAGYNRIDLVVAEFVRNGGGAGVDTLQFKIVKGTSTTGTPADPTLTADDINVEANTTRQEALYRLTITGTTLADPELMAGVLDNLDAKAPLASPTFTGTPTAPTATSGTSTTQIANTKFATDQDIGVGQAWAGQSKSLGVTYTNSTSRPIVVCVLVTVSNGFITAEVDGIPFYLNGTTAQTTGGSFIVPSGKSYKVTASNGGIATWAELR